MKPNQRKSLIATIKIAQAHLDLDDDTYRALLERETGKRSAAKLNFDELNKVIDAMRRLGFAAKSGQHRQAKPSVSDDCRALIGKIEAVLAEGGKPWAYAEAMARRMVGKQRLQWCTAAELHKIAAALQIHHNRKEKGAKP